MQSRIFGECMTLTIKYQKILSRIIGKKNVWITQLARIAKFTNKNQEIFLKLFTPNDYYQPKLLSNGFNQILNEGKLSDSNII